MANYCGITRTNYFRITDLNVFTDVINRMITDADEVHIFDREINGETYYGFGLYGTIYGLMAKDKTDADDPDEDEYDDGLVHEALQEVLRGGDAIVIEEIGSEKLRYLVGYATIITKEEIKGIDLQKAVTKEISGMLGRDDYMFIDTY